MTVAMTAVTAGANGQNAMLEGHEATLVSVLMNRARSLDLEPDDFSSPISRTIFEAISAVDIPELYSVQDELIRRGKLSEVGDKAGLTAICNLSEGRGDDSIDYALHEVLDASRARREGEIGDALKKGEITGEEAIERLGNLRRRKGSWSDALDSAIVTSSALAGLELQPRKLLLGDWFGEGDLGFIIATRGVGKTWFALLLAKALSEGGKVGEWSAPAPTKVLYIDGEMPPDLMRLRDKGLKRATGDVDFLNHEILFDRTQKVLNITQPDAQKAITDHCLHHKVKVLILDNLSTLASGMKENDSFEWERVNNWLLQFRRHKIAVIVVHHAGRNGEARGTSKREDAAFWVIALDDAKKHADDKTGARFISRFTKPSRNTQEEIPSYEWHVTTDNQTGVIRIDYKLAQSLDVFRWLIEEGVTDCTQLAQELKVSPGTVSKWAKKAIDAGWLRKKGRDYQLVAGNDGNEDL